MIMCKHKVTQCWSIYVLEFRLIYNVENVKTSNHHYVKEQLVPLPISMEGISTHPDHPTPFLYNNGRVVLFRFGIVKTPTAETRSSIRIKLSSYSLFGFDFCFGVYWLWCTLPHWIDWCCPPQEKGGQGSRSPNLEGKLLFFLALK